MPDAPIPQRLRLLKVVVQPTYAWDDGETLTEQQTSPTEIPARDWPAFAARDPLTWANQGQAPAPSDGEA